MIFPPITPDTYIISDTHLAHKNITHFEPSRLEKMYSMGYTNHDKFIKDNWNNTVLPDSNVLHLGDLAFKDLDNQIKDLNGHKTLILGNHDRKPLHQAYTNNNWITVNGLYFLDKYTFKFQTRETEVQDDMLFSAIIAPYKGKRVLFSHYPVFENDNYDFKNPKISSRIRTLENLFQYYGCDYCVHGHSHSRKNTKSFNINVSLEQTDFKPIRLGEIL